MRDVLTKEEFSEGLMQALEPLRGQPVTAMTRDMAQCQIQTFLNQQLAAGRIAAPRLPDPEKWIKVSSHAQDKGALCVDFDRRGFIRALRDLDPVDVPSTRQAFASMFQMNEADWRGTPSEIAAAVAQIKFVAGHQHNTKKELRKCMRTGGDVDTLRTLQREVARMAAELRELHLELEDLKR